MNGGEIAVDLQEQGDAVLFIHRALGPLEIRTEPMKTLSATGSEVLDLTRFAVEQCLDGFVSASDGAIFSLRHGVGSFFPCGGFLVETEGGLRRVVFARNSGPDLPWWITSRWTSR